MDTELMQFLAERFDAIDRRLDRIERRFGHEGRDHCEPCGQCESCRRGRCCERCRQHGCCERCRQHGCCERCRQHGCCVPCRRRGCCGRPHCGGRDGVGGTLRAFGEAQALLGAFERVQDDRMSHGLDHVRDSVHLLSRRVSSLERRLCWGDSTC